MQVVAGFGVHDEALATRFDIALGHHIGRQHHEVRFKRFFSEMPRRCNYIGPKREVGHELPVHDIPLNEVNASGVQCGNGFTQLGEIHRQH